MKYIEVLKKVGLKATPQRVAVLKELSKKTHPTMDEIYENIKKENPSISLATVYKNVNILRDTGLVIEINIPSKKMRYDYLATPHIHIICTNCGHVEDLDYDEHLFDYQTQLEKDKNIVIDRLDVVASTSSCIYCKSK